MRTRAIMRLDERLVDAIWDAALDSSQWGPVLERIARWLHSTIGMIGDSNISTAQSGFAAFAGAPDEINTLFSQRHVVNPLIERSMAIPLGVVGTTDALIPLEELERTELYVDVLRPAGAIHGIGCNLAADGEWLTSVNAYRPRARGAFDEHECRALAQIIPHLQHASRTRRRLADIDAQRAAALEAVEIAPTATILVDGKGAVVFANATARAILGRRDGLGTSHNRLSTADLESASRLRRLIGCAADTGEGRRRDPGGTMLVPRPSGARPWVVMVSPLRAHGLDAGSRRPAAAIFIADPAHGSRPQSGSLQDLFGLTEAEARVALLLSEGKGLKHVAGRLGVSTSTVKTHVQRALDKTGTNRQAELTALVLHVGSLGHRPPVGR